jgi:hypothetical protein
VRETVLALSGFVGNVVLLLALFWASDAFDLDKSVPYLFTLLVVWKIGLSYQLVELQSRGFGVYEYYGGRVRNGFLLAMAGGFMLRQPVSDWLGHHEPYGALLKLVFL